MKKYTIEKIDNYFLIHNENGCKIALSDINRLIEDDGYAFKDLNGNGILDPYEDWRLPIEERIENLVKQMSIHQIAGLMLYSAHQAVSTQDNLFAKMFQGTYDGKSLAESGKSVYELSDQQKQFLLEDDLRHVLLTVVDDAQTAARWNNRMQALVEQNGLGIPCNNSSDPRHSASANTEYNAGSGGDISKWPESLGLAATFDPQLLYEFGQIASKEYRALGITTALSPQIDLASEPRWMRFCGTFGEHANLSADLAQAYCDGFQTSENVNGWGNESVNTMVKHWPGGGSGEGGRDGHYAYGKYAVYPGNNFDQHLIPFTKGAFNLQKGTHHASAVMPYYTISTGVAEKNVGNSYSHQIISQLLRDEYQYDGVVCTDWMITQDASVFDSFFGGKCWGVEQISEARRHYQILMAGVDQFGGNNDIQPVLEAYQMGIEEHGEAWMRQRFEKSAKRLLRNMFRTGLFENPYVDPQYAMATVGNQDYMKKGFDAQLKSAVLLKNKNQVLPLPAKSKVYIPNRRIKESRDWFGNVISAHEECPVEKAIVERYFTLCENAEEADFALVLIESPASVGYSKEAGYLPINLQYRPYQAIHARENSIGQDCKDEIVNRSYRGKTNSCSNEADLDIILETRAKMGNKPVIVSINCKNPTVVKEFEAVIDGLFVTFDIQTQALLELICGNVEPSALLPFQMPCDMEEVENQKEDVPLDMKPYLDSEGHLYDFAYGLNYQGVIEDERTRKYHK